jgi:hypothetical protein
MIPQSNTRNTLFFVEDANSNPHITVYTQIFVTEVDDLSFGFPIQHATNSEQTPGTAVVGSARALLSRLQRHRSLPPTAAPQQQPSTSPFTVSLPPSAGAGANRSATALQVSGGCLGYCKFLGLGSYDLLEHVSSLQQLVSRHLYRPVLVMS